MNKHSTDTSRLDFFIVFAHGLPFTEEIMNMIRDDNNFEILYVRKMQTEDMNNFITDLYACDTVPFEHLVAKTRYLLTVANDFLFILVKNKNPDEKMCGEGEFSHIQCTRIVALKNKIRDLFNPRLPDGSRSEDHVIHASDYQSQTHYVLDMLKLPGFEYFLRKPNPEFNLMYFVPPFSKYEIKTVKAEDILCRNGKDIVPIKDSFHYRYLMGDKEPYKKYISKALGVIDCADHSPQAFMRLLQNFNYCRANYLLAEEKNGKYLLNDGNHRAAILYYQGVKEIPLIVFTPFATQLQLHYFFNLIPVDLRYVVLRRKEWLPLYYEGEDMDLLTDNYAALCGAIMQFAKIYPYPVTVNQQVNHCHIDFLDHQNNIHFRFDIIEKLVSNKFFISDAYTAEVLSHAKKINQNGAMISIPAGTDDLIIRYIEYRDNPGKKQHLEYVKDRANADFFTDLSVYTDLKPDI